MNFNTETQKSNYEFEIIIFLFAVKCEIYPSMINDMVVHKL